MSAQLEMFTAKQYFDMLVNAAKSEQLVMLEGHKHDKKIFMAAILIEPENGASDEFTIVPVCRIPSVTEPFKGVEIATETKH